MGSGWVFVLLVTLPFLFLGMEIRRYEYIWELRSVPINRVYPKWRSMEEMEKEGPILIKHQYYWNRREILKVERVARKVRLKEEAVVSRDYSRDYSRIYMAILILFLFVMGILLIGELFRLDFMDSIRDDIGEAWNE